MNEFDVIIAGGGLAGLTLGIQLKKERKETSVCIIESSKKAPKISAHKVGESTVELGTYYLREVVGLADYLDQNQLPKHGLRFFFTPSEKENIDRRYELGPVDPPPVPSHQLDRGVFEAELTEKNREMGNTVRSGERVLEAELSAEGHVVQVGSKDHTDTLKAKWFVDTTGRTSFLKKKLSLEKSIDHNINAVWFRVNKNVDIQTWSDDDKWQSKMAPGLRRLSTTHLMGEGYWVWIIPLVTGNTSIGIVADPRYHEFTAINRYDAAMEWLKKHEPQCAREIGHDKDTLLDFKILKDYAFNTTKLYSDEKWCLSGEAGAFLDPFYSPGTDFIGLSNSWITDLIAKDLNEEDIYVQTVVYEKVFQAIIENWAEVYRDKYSLFGSTKIMLAKIVWDWANYWAVHTLIFMNKGYTNMKILKTLFFGDNGIGLKIAAINSSVQQLFLDWHPLQKEEIKADYLDPFELPFLKELHLGLKKSHTPPELIDRVNENLTLLEQIAAELMRHVQQETTGSPPEEFINPYTFRLENSADKSKAKFEAQIPVNKEIRVQWDSI